ncbi:DUF3987 domain-containing protein [Nostoc sp. PA-18-2419]|uniref:DUF3987 domain-containing protein n=1 Tax=Nostoc sp. PA-18-2419 TaxID=2575443 RepID=UPI001678E7AE|nr:DUF3987 domain-containing protein [Nostoc sp. PA-18-2419]
MHTTQIQTTTASRLISGLQQIPGNWALTPVTDNKRPYREDWQRETALNRQALIKELQSGKALGYGIRTGEVSGGILAIDADGHAAEALLQKLADGDLPDTVIFSSGKAGRRQLLYFVTEEYWQVVKTVKLKTGVKGDDGKEQLLEFRWNGLQSVLPPSVHPQTGSYHWVRSPIDIEVANCPNWVIELMLNQPVAVPKPQFKSVQTTVSDRPNLSIFLGRDDRDLVEHGTGDGGRNDAAKKLSLNLIATARRLNELGIDYDCDPRTIYDQFCANCTPPLGSDVRSEADGWWKNAEAHAKHPSLDDDKLQGCYIAWLNKQKGIHSQKRLTVQNSIVSTDNSLLSVPPLTMKMIEKQTSESIVSVVSGILAQNSDDVEESFKLDLLRTELVISQRVFDRIVARERVKLYEVLPEDEMRLKSLIEWRNTKIDWGAILPAPLARDLIHDADVLNVDPVVIWQPLLSAVASLAGTTINLDMQSHKIPSVLWTVTVLESGGGKTRADSLVVAPLRKMQADAVQRYKDADSEYKRALKEWERSGCEGLEPEPPALRKYLFEVATIQAVLKRSAENAGYGSLWARDEIAGLFNSLGQFSRGEDESLQILLKLWDAAALCVDRTSITDSYFAERTAVSLTGGIQPAVFRKTFKDADDSNGLQARMLFAVPQRRKQRYVEGFCQLSERLPLLYKWMEELPELNIKISPQAKAYYKKLVEIIGDQIEQTTHAAIRNWMSKLPTQVLRIALIIHLLECFYSPNSRDITTLQKDTLERAVKLAQYYRSAFHVLQEKVSNSDEISSILLQIYDRASQTSDGVSVRDIYRPLDSIKSRAKAAGREASAYTHDLFLKMQQMGYGEIVRKGRSVRFVARKLEDLEKPLTTTDNTDNEEKYISNALESDEIHVSDSHCQLLTVSTDNSVMHVDYGENNVIDQTEIPPLDDSIDLPQVEAVDTVLTKPQQVEENAATPEITKGARVRVYCPGSKRHGLEGIVTRFIYEQGLLKAIVLLENVSASLRIWECFVPGNEGMRLELVS